jgi:hypothetical protein
MYLLVDLPVGEYVFQGYVEFTHVVLSESVLVPANRAQHSTLLAHDGHIEGLIPFWVEGLVDCRGGFFLVSKRENEEL